MSTDLGVTVRVAYQESVHPDLIGKLVAQAPIGIVRINEDMDALRGFYDEAGMSHILHLH